MAVEPTKGSRTFAMAFQIERGKYGNVPLDGLGFIILGLTPEAMGKGNWSAGVIGDGRASAEQRDAIAAIASGSSGGPMAALSALVGTFLGVESAPIRFERSGLQWSVTARPNSSTWPPAGRTGGWPASGPGGMLISARRIPFSVDPP